MVRKVVAAPHSRICPSLLPPTLPTADCLPKGKEHHQQTETLPVMDKNTLHHHPHHHVQQVHYNKNKKTLLQRLLRGRTAIMIRVITRRLWEGKLCSVWSGIRTLFASSPDLDPPLSETRSAPSSTQSSGGGIL